MSVTYTMTYDKVTPESAEEGCFSESGFYMPGGWEYPTDDAPTGPAFLEWCQRMGPFEIEGTVREVLDTIRGWEDNGGGSFYEVDADIDYTTGEETRRALHLHASARNIERIRKLHRAIELHRALH